MTKSLRSSDFPRPQRRPANSSAAASRIRHHGATQPTAAPAAATRWPQPPDPSILSEAIPLFFIGRNKDGFWVARDADGSVGGIFLLKRSAVRFANRTTQPCGCATMFMSERFELDIENKGNPFVVRLGGASRLVSRLARRLTASAKRTFIARFSRPLLVFAIFGGIVVATIALRFAIWLPLSFLLKAI
jgi:hypothetical protein